MNRNEFIIALKGRLNSLSEADKAKAVLYYEEMLADRIDDGMNEEQAIVSLGDVNSIAEELLAEMPIVAIVQSKVKGSQERSQNKRLWNVIAICTSPIWFPLLLTGIAVAFVLYLVVWVLIAACYILELAFALLTGGCALFGLWHLFNANIYESLVLFSVSVASLGLLILTFVPMVRLSKNFTNVGKAYWNKLKLLLVKGKEV